MSGFAIGEVAVLHGLKNNPAFNGCECVIEGRLNANYYGISGCGDWKLTHKKHLRKKRPPDELTAWTEALECIDRAMRPAGVPA